MSFDKYDGFYGKDFDRKDDCDKDFDCKDLRKDFDFKDFDGKDFDRKDDCDKDFDKKKEFCIPVCSCPKPCPPPKPKPCPLKPECKPCWCEIYCCHFDKFCRKTCVPCRLCWSCSPRWFCDNK